ncbi:helix-turn-helix transcriptional regulator [Cellulomonas sp. KH9]|uniref:ArsR/SmtB family transcription factor n=1 Tax=Cellulomonas sp. KH9 TaxID=1855324 RepID=UPI0008E0AB56|nr:metalloregulator ArsR/SmtB family transcription factor [Cellulomonas sp. KH9]SFK20355.1 transcriptional regulator, ArsR family [Cellulomonas sp. KH9]
MSTSGDVTSGTTAGRSYMRPVEMPEPSPDAELDRLFHALSDATRRAMVERLAQGAASVSALAAPFPMSMPAVVQHLAVLERAGVVASQKVGRVRTYRLTPDGTLTARTWLDRHRLHAERALDRLSQHGHRD